MSRVMSSQVMKMFESDDVEAAAADVEDEE
jgi:hypothetical protein